MNPPRIPFFLSFITKLTNVPESFRTFVIVSGISLYGLILYEFFPEQILVFNNAIANFIIPAATIIGIGIGLPRAMPFIMEKIFKKPFAKSTQPEETKPVDDIFNELVTDGSTQQLVETGSQDLVGDTHVGDSSEISSKELDEIISGAAKKEGIDENTVGIDPASLSEGGRSIMGDDKVRDIVDQKFEPVEKDLASFKKDLSKIKEDMKITKDSVDTLTESFEGTLTDMKAFQAEISNPLNFMRKYFESLDLKILQDPSLPLRQQYEEESVPTKQITKEKETILIPTGIERDQSIQADPSQLSLSNIDNTGTSESSSKDTMDSVMKPLFSGNLSVGKMMSIVELAGDMLKEQGDDCIDLLLEQCKLMGLKPEDEHTIYNIIEMLKNSGMNVEDSLIQLYKFSKIVGLTDKEADAHYSKLMANKNRKKLGRGE
jgi:hypothetical protein